VSENLQRQDIRPSEEGEAFKRILDKGKDIRYISERFGKSDSFIHGRLSLVRLIPKITRLLDVEEISISMAVEISKLEAPMQEHLLREHLETEIISENWKKLPFKTFRERLENTYTTLLSRFSFDKSDCMQCPGNSEFYSLFPVLENSRCTRSACLVKKQENHILNTILSAIGNENVEVYINYAGGVHADIIERLTELGIEVKRGQVYPMPDNPVAPLEDHFAGNPTGFEQAQKDFLSKQTKWNDLQDLMENGLARKVVVIENLVPVFGYITVPQVAKSNESFTSNDSHDTPSATENTERTDNDQIQPSAKEETNHPSIKPDLISTLEQKDGKNREEALCKVIADAKELMKDTDIPPVEITPFEDALIYYIMLSYLDYRHCEFFGIPEGEAMTEEIRLNLYNSLSDEQKNTLKRDFLINNLIQGSGISKRAALLVELAKYHFPDDMAIIEGSHNGDYMAKREIIREQIENLQLKNKELQEVA